MVCICYASCIDCDQIYNSLSHLARINSYITVDLLCFFYSGKPLVLYDSLLICSFPLVFLSLSTLTLCTLQLSGRWYLFMDTRNNIIRDNTYGDFEIASNGKLMISLYRYFPDLEDCRTTSFMLQPLSSDPSPEVAVEFDLIRMSTKEKHGKQVILFIDNHPETGFAIMHLKTRIDAYLVVTRSKNPSNKSAVIASIEAALCDLGLDVKDFATKSTNYGCETKTEHGFQL